MRALLPLAMVFLVGCSALLGIEDPSPGSVDSTDHLSFSFGDFKLAQRQTVHLRVQLVHPDGSSLDVTTSADYTSDDPAIAMIGDAGLVNGLQAGTTTIKVSLGAAAPATVMATVKPTPCHLVINELTTGTVASAAEEWVELYNPCMDPIDVTGWTLDYRAAGNTLPTDKLMIALTGQVDIGAFQLFAGFTYTGQSDGTWPDTSGILQQMSAGVALRDGADAIIDAIAYGSVAAGHPFLEMSPAPMMINGRSASRLPFDGKDDDDNSIDVMVITTPTPRATNAP